MSEVNNPEMEITEENGTIDFPENFMDSVYDDKINNEVLEDEETDEELKDSGAPDEAEDEVPDDDNDDDVEDDSEDESEDDLEEDGEDDKDEEVWDISDVNTNQVIRLADGSETNIKDLIDGQMMQSDYTKKTTALATERKELEAKQEDVVKQSKRFVTEHQSIANAWSDELMEAETQFRTNPTDQEAKQRYDVATVSHKAAVRQHEETEAVHTQQLQEVSKRRVQNADAYAIEHIEGWNQDMAGELLGYVAETTGASNNEILEVISGPMLVIVANAMKQAKGAEVTSKKRTIAKKKGKSLKKTASKAKKTSKSSKQVTADKAAIDKYAESGDFSDLNTIFPENFMDEFK